MTRDSTKRFNQLFYPILIEQFFFLLMSQIDVLMLAGVGLSTVAAVGLANQVLMIVTFILTIIHVGVSIRMIHIKEKYPQDIINFEISRSIVLNLIVTFIFSTLIILLIDPILDLLNIPQEVYIVTKQFSMILLSLTIVHTTNMMIGTILRIVGRAKIVTIVSIFMNSINIVLNAYILYFAPDQFASPVSMVAWSTNISRIIGLILLVYFARQYFSRVNVFDLNSDYLKKVISLGLPSAGEHISYNLSQLILTALIASLGTLAVSSKMLTQSITGLAFTFAISFSMANQIFLGRYIAKKKFSTFIRIVNRNLVISAFTSVLLVIMITATFFYIGNVKIDTTSYKLILSLLLLSILLEPLRAMNVFYVQMLNVLGDVRYPVTINIIVTWLVLLPCAFIAVEILGYGIKVIFILMILDECIRVMLMYTRFRNGKWKSMTEKIGV